MKKNATPLFKRSVIRNTAKKVFLIALFCAAAGFLFAADTGPDPAKGSVEVSTWQLVKHGGWLMIPIGLCSLIALAYAAERFINLRLDKIIPEEFTGGLAVRLKAKDYKGARDLCKKDRSPFAEVFLAGLREVDNGPERMEKAIEDTGTREMSILRQNVRPLKIVSEIAPLLGLLGTIQGMMGAFQKISEVGIGKKTEIFAGNIFQALVTTAA